MHIHEKIFVYKSLLCKLLNQMQLLLFDKAYRIILKRSYFLK